jgi:hypothetical protein
MMLQLMIITDVQQMQVIQLEILLELQIIAQQQLMLLVVQITALLKLLLLLAELPLTNIILME